VIGREVTPLVLTHDESPNIRRALDSLRWADRVVVLDSGSKDDTIAIARSYPNVEVFTRPFDSFKGQTDFGLTSAGIDTDHVLALDADMAVPGALVDEIEERYLPGGFAGALVPFEYRIFGRALMGSLLGPQLRLFRRAAVRVVQDGHGHKFAVDGAVYTARAPLAHDDRKSLERWVSSQLGYSRVERERLARPSASRGLRDRIRRSGLSPLAAGALAYARAGGPLRGGAALRYAYERVVFECLLAMRLIEDDLVARERASTGASTGASTRDDRGR
jgi:glycosyltransferase involved in cell wall biosynthesis